VTPAARSAAIVGMVGWRTRGVITDAGSGQRKEKIQH
jgi:hypothetical protein